MMINMYTDNLSHFEYYAFSIVDNNFVFWVGFLWMSVNMFTVYYISLGVL